MPELEELKRTYWLVQLGKMYYAGGLSRLPHNDESFSYEFVRDKDVAFHFFIEDIAYEIADKCGGEVVERKMTLEEALLQQDKQEKYSDSEKEIDRQGFQQAMKEL